MAISVCMATFNGRRFVRRQLETILPQLHPDDELIVSDDASSDGTPDLVREICGTRVRLLQGNFRSPVRNFEHALRHAHGSIIVLTDQDDVWLPGRLDLVRSRLAAQRERVALLMMDGTIVDEDERDSGRTLFAQTRASRGVLRNIYDNCYVGCCLAFTRPLLELALPFPARIPMHDMWLGLLAELFGTVEFVPVATIRYRRHGNNASLRRSSLLVKVGRRLFLSSALIVRSLAILLRRRHQPA